MRILERAQIKLLILLLAMSAYSDETSAILMSKKGQLQSQVRLAIWVI